MPLFFRNQVIVCCLLLVALFSAPSSGTAQGSISSPVLSAVAMSSPFGTVSVSGEGFTPGGLVRLIVHDLSGTGPVVDTWVVTESGAIDVTLPYLTAATYGPHGSQDPARGYVMGTLSTDLPVAEIFGPYGSQDPALGYVSSTMLWQGACPNLIVNGWDARSGTWSNALDIRFAGC